MKDGKSRVIYPKTSTVLLIFAIIGLIGISIYFYTHHADGYYYYDECLYYKDASRWYEYYEPNDYDNKHWGKSSGFDYFNPNIIVSDYYIGKTIDDVQASGYIDDLTNIKESDIWKETHQHSDSDIYIPQ